MKITQIAFTAAIAATLLPAVAANAAIRYDFTSSATDPATASTYGSFSVVTSDFVSGRFEATPVDFTNCTVFNPVGGTCSRIQALDSDVNRGYDTLFFSSNNFSASSAFFFSDGAFKGLGTYNSLISAPGVRGTLTVSNVTGAVPEPATWAMMIVGFGMAGAAMRRHKRQMVAYA